METMQSRIKTIRGQKSLKTMAELIGMTKSSYDRCERGEQEFKAEDIKNICKQFNISADFLLFGRSTN